MLLKIGAPVVVDEIPKENGNGSPNGDLDVEGDEVTPNGDLDVEFPPNIAPPLMLPKGVAVTGLEEKELLTSNLLTSPNAD